MSKFDLGDSGGGGGFSDEKNDNQDTKIDDTMQSTKVKEWLKDDIGW